MKDNVFLIFNKKGFSRSTKTPTALRLGEVGVEVSMDIANALFERPKLRATLTVDENAVPKFELTPTVLSDVAQSIKIWTGMDVKVEAVETDST